MTKSWILCTPMLLEEECKKENGGLRLDMGVA